MRAILLLTAALFSLKATPPKILTIEHPALHQFEDGPNLSQDFAFTAGETIFFDFQIGGYATTEEGNVKLTWTVQVKDPAGIDLIPPADGKVVTELTDQDKKWQPKVRVEIPVPPHAPSGTYKLLMAVEDALGKTAAKREATFQVRGHQVNAAESLQVVSFGFYRSEEAPQPIHPAAYRPGDTVWMRFDIVGFRLADGHRYDVSYGIAVLRSNGESMFAQPDAAAERGESFYPRRYIPAGLSLNLQKDIHPGQYTVVITVKDAAGGQQAETKQSFSVEQ